MITMLEQLLEFVFALFATEKREQYNEKVFSVVINTNLI